MKKSQVNRFPKGSYEYVVAHAKWRRSRGKKNPSATIPFFRSNPREALKFAERYAYFSVSGAYLSGKVPEYYVCGECGAHDVKLWRGYQEMSPTLLCAECAAKLEEKDISDIDAAGCRSDEMNDRTDTIGWQVPAVPLEDIKGYWGYTSVPRPGVEWWKNLPTLRVAS